MRHWTDSLFSFTTTRSPSFRFTSGQFTMMGLETADRPLVRAYSLVSPPYEDTLEFLSIKVPDGPLTSRLQHIKESDRILVSRKPTGTLVIHNLLPGRTLYLLATGTGLAPFMSIIRDPETYERFEKIVLVHGCRQVAELAYGERIVDLPEDELIGEYRARAAHLLPDGDARALPEPRAASPTSSPRGSSSATWAARARRRARPRHAVRQPADARPTCARSWRVSISTKARAASPASSSSRRRSWRSDWRPQSRSVSFNTGWPPAASRPRRARVTASGRA